MQLKTYLSVKSCQTDVCSRKIVLEIVTDSQNFETSSNFAMQQKPHRFLFLA